MRLLDELERCETKMLRFEEWIEERLFQISEKLTPIETAYSFYQVPQNMQQARQLRELELKIAFLKGEQNELRRIKQRGWK